MEKHVKKSDRRQDRNLCYKNSKNEKEIYNINYEDSSDQLSSDICSFINKPDKESDHLADTVELSLEVEIADSLKQLIASPEKHASQLLDVTIVRPSDLESTRGNEINTTTALRASEVRKLIAKMERKKIKKKRLIEECKKKVENSKMNPIMEMREMSSNSSSKEFSSKRGKDNNLASHKHKGKRSENSRHTRHNIAVMSAPPKTIHYHSTKAEKRHHKKYLKDKETNIFTCTSSISVLKPLVGEIKQSLKNLEFKIADVGDQNEKIKHKKNYSRSSSTSDSRPSRVIPDKQHKRYHNLDTTRNYNTNTHQVYTTANFDKIRNLLVCQNKDNNEGNKDKPCMCQHCGMVGLLVESQKRPLINILPQSDEPSDKLDEELLSKRQKNAGRKFGSDENNYKMMKELLQRMEVLETRMTIQEEQAVSKNYFKRVMTKILNREFSKSKHIELKSHGTQYHSKSFENLFAWKRKSDIKNKYKHDRESCRCSKETYCVNPVFIQTDSELASDEQVLNKSVGYKAMSAISDFFTKLAPDKTNEGRRDAETTTTPKEKRSPVDTFWKWGEEIIKPGFDLKTKIMSLLEEQFCNAKTNNKTVGVKITRSRIFRQNARLALNLFEDPVPYEDKEVQVVGQNKQNEKYSSRTVRKVLDLMSEKIYKEHVKPTVDALKHEQKTLNNQNAKQIINMKAAMESAFVKLNSKQTQPQRNLSKTELDKHFLQPLKVPATIKQDESERKPNEIVSKTVKRSGIPIRIVSMSPTDSKMSVPPKRLETKNSHIPRLKSPERKLNNTHQKHKLDKSRREDDKISAIKAAKKKDQIMETTCKRQDMQAESNKKYKLNSKPVQITYVSPKIGYWNEESSASINNVSEENQTLNNKSSRSSIKSELHQDKKRRISKNVSVADKVAFLTKITNAEMGKAQLWNNIWNQAKNHCQSKQDTVVIQIPTKCKHNNSGLTEIEFTIEDIQKLVNASAPLESIEGNHRESKEKGESFLLIRSRKILDEVHKRLGGKSIKKT